MRKVKNLIVIASLALGMFVMSSCTEDLCKDVVCENGGVCEEGDCICATGFEGELCETAMNTKFVGSYNVAETCQPSGFAGNYSLQITAGAAANKIVFSNLGDYETPAMITADVNGRDISVTNFTDAAGRKFSVNGTMNAVGTSITLSYTVTFIDATIDNCECTFIRL